jgi:hypothetical protein
MHLNATGRCLLALATIGAVVSVRDAACAPPPEETPARIELPPVSRSPDPVKKLDCFPVSTQFSPLPSGQKWKGEEGPLSAQVLRASVDNIIAHGFTGLEANTHRPTEESKYILDYARQRGMIITHHAGGLEMFGRDAPPAPSVYAPDYASRVRRNAEQRLAAVADIPRLYNVFIFQDEPFHWGPKSFGTRRRK